MAMMAPLLAGGLSPLAQDLANRLAPPSALHWFGTDELGRDIYARTLYGARVTLTIVVLVSVIVAPIGLAVGTLAGYLGGWVDAVLMRITDIFLPFPRLVLALAFAAALGPGIENAVIAISLTAWPPYARIARAETVTIASSDFIHAVVMQGASTWRILFRHIVPLCLSSLIVRLTLDMAGIILTAAGLGFLGLGAQPPTAEWGAMVSAGREVILDQWWVATIPGIAIFIVSLGFNLLGDGLRDVLDPKAIDERHPAHRRRPQRELSRTAPASPARCAMPASRWGASGWGSSASRAPANRPLGRAVLGLIPRPGIVTARSWISAGRICWPAAKRTGRRCAARRMSMVMQDPKYSLNPVQRIGQQIGETCRLHLGSNEARCRAAHARHARGGENPRSRHGLSSLSAPTVGRHGPACHDRHDAGGGA